MKKSILLPRVLHPPASIQNANHKKASFEFEFHSPIEEPAKDIRSPDRKTRHWAAEKLVDLASDKKARLDAVRAIRELGRAAREHEEEISTSFIEKFGIETFREVVDATAKRNNIIFGAFALGSFGLLAASYLSGSVPLGIAAISSFAIVVSRFVVKGPALNLLHMSESDAWKILERHELHELEQKNK